jgi:hypothetical protein
MAKYGANLVEFVPREILKEVEEKFGNGGR